MVLPVFIFDTDILDALKNKQDGRVEFIHQAISKIQQQLTALDSTLYVACGKPIDIYKQLTTQYNIAAVFTNHDYEPYAQKRDNDIKSMLAEKGIPLHTFKDQVIFEKNEVVKDNNEPYTVFTPYSRKWKEKMGSQPFVTYDSLSLQSNFMQSAPRHIPTLSEIGFEKTGIHFSVPVLDEHVAASYDKTRDYPAVNGTTRMSVHLRFGTVSIRQLANSVAALNGTLLNELIWREFYQMILWHFPYVVNGSFKKQYDNIVWRNNEQEFEKWCKGKTGYPIVDAGMRELNTTGFMHNRVRMVTASFLTKHLLIDWRWGEAYFAEKLMDFDLAANNGGWQWAAGSGCDAAPYFRIFNPYLQTQKFDPELKYVKKWVPEFETLEYQRPVVDHAIARDRCLKVYKQALNKE